MKYVICLVCSKDFYLIGPEKYTKCVYCNSLCKTKDELIAKKENTKEYLFAQDLDL